jgi:hypothetical protein
MGASLMPAQLGTGFVVKTIASGYRQCVHWSSL